MNHFHGLKVVALILALCFGSALNAQQEKSEDNFEISLRTGAGFKHYNLDFAKSNDAPFINLGASIKTGPVIIAADIHLKFRKQEDKPAHQVSMWNIRSYT